MDYNKINMQMTVLAILIVINVFFVYSRSFVDDVPNCDGYITNVYLYVSLGLLITAFTILFIAKRKYPITAAKSLIAFAIGLMALFTMYMINPRQALLNHLVWIVFLISIAVMLYVVWRYSSYRGTLTSTLVMVFLLVVGLTMVAHFKPEWISLGWGSALTVALLAIILAWVVPLLFGYTKGMTTYYKILSAILTFVFMLFILYDTKLLRVKAKQCVIPDYPTDSMGLFLDIVNLFSSMSIIR